MKEEGSDDDPLLSRLQDKYTKQRREQLASRRRWQETELTAQAAKNNALPPSLELISDETARAFTELEALLVSENSSSAAEQLRCIRKAVNEELRQSLAYLEEGYHSAFHTLGADQQLAPLSTPERPLPSPATAGAELSGSHSGAGTHLSKLNTTAGKAKKERAVAIVSGSTGEPQIFPEDWSIGVKASVSSELRFQASHRVQSLARKLSVREAMSSVTALFAESLASLLVCEVVRIYLYDENHSLHCCACFPPTAVQGDPMRATYKEIMLSKEVHTSVCDKGLAVNGSEAEYNVLSQRDTETITAEAEASGWGSMKSCLIFPIVFHAGSQGSDGQLDDREQGRHFSAGMIHAVNKLSTVPNRAGKFTADDEVLMSMAARLLGCMMTRYSVEFFTLRLGDSLWRATHPRMDLPDPRSHLPEKLPEVIEDAALVGMRSMLAPEPVLILRAPINDVYQTRTFRSRKRKLGNLVVSDSGLSAVDFHLTAVNELWENGMQENVLMHQQYRALGEQVSSMKLLVCNLLDGLSTARSMEDARDMARYLQTLESLARREDTSALSAYIAGALLEAQRKKATVATAGSAPPLPPVARPSPHGESILLLPSAARAPGTDAGATAEEDASTQAEPLNSVFLTSEEVADLATRQARLNESKASSLHLDGPEGIRAYSSDPSTKRAQILFIEAMQNSRILAQRQILQAEAASEASSSAAPERPAALGNSATSVSPSTSKTMRLRTAAAPRQRAAATSRTLSTLQTSSSDFAAKRPLQL